MKYLKYFVLFFILMMLGCARNYDPVQPLIVNRQYQHQQNAVFDAALSVATLMNLNVAVIEKSSGLIRFSNDTYGASLLDKYCKPHIVDGRGRPKYTFTEWSNDRMDDDLPPLVGSAQVTLLVSVIDGKTNINLRTNFKAGSVAVNSTGLLEETFLRYLEEKLGRASRTNFR
jgi:hypothetical protein